MVSLVVPRETPSLLTGQFPPTRGIIETKRVERAFHRNQPIHRISGGGVGTIRETGNRMPEHLRNRSDTTGLNRRMPMRMWTPQNLDDVGAIRKFYFREIGFLKLADDHIRV